MWPVFAPKCQWSRKNPGCIGIPLPPEIHRDSLPRYALSGGLAARLWVKPSPSVVADSKERRRRALPEYASKCATIWEKSQTEPWYARGLVGGNDTGRDRLDLCRLQPSATAAQTRSAMGGAVRDHDASLAAGGQKYRW